MANTNAFSAWAIAVGANVLTPTAYAALATRPDGFQSGITPSIVMNTALRQSTFVATMIAQFTADYGPNNVNDDGVIANFEASFVLAIANATNSAIVAYADTGTSDALVIAPTPVPAAWAKGLTFWIQKSAAANATTTPTLNFGGGAKTIVRRGGGAMGIGDLKASGYFLAYYDGTVVRVLSPYLTSEVNDAVAPMFQGAKSGLLTSAPGGASTLGIAAGAACSDDGTFMMVAPAAFTKTTGAFVAGTGNGALDSGTIAASAWYNVFEISTGVFGSTPDYLFSLSSNVLSPTMPSGYTKKRLIGHFLTDSSSHILAFTQIGGGNRTTFLWGSVVNDLVSSSIGTGSTNIAIHVPPGQSVKAKIWAGMSVATAGVGLIYSPLLGTLTAAGGRFNVSWSSATVGQGSDLEVWTDTAQHVAATSSVASTSISGSTYGWEENL